MVNTIQKLLNINIAKTMLKGTSTVSSPNIASTVNHVGIKPQIITDTFSKTIPQDILGIPLKGHRVQDIPIIRMIEQSILHMNKYNPKMSPIYKEIVFESVPKKTKGVAYVPMGTRTLHVNSYYFDHIDEAITNDLNIFIKKGLITKDKNGTYKIAPYLRNAKSEIFETRLNEYDKSWSLLDKFMFHRVSMNYYANLVGSIAGESKSPILLIEKIMKAGDNQSTLKKLGLFKSRDEVMKMSVDEQMSYLKQIGVHCPPPVNSVCVTYPDYAFNHEAIHSLHSLNLSPKLLQELSSEAKITEWCNNKVIQDTALKVSGYAAQQPLEFVAEVGAGLANGQVFDKEVMELYRFLKGPNI